MQTQSDEQKNNEQNENKKNICDNRKYVTSPDDIVTTVCSLEEQETVLQISRNEKIINGWSSDNTFLTKIKRLIRNSSSKWKVWEGSKNSDGNITGYFFEAPKNLLSLRIGNTGSGRSMSEEERERCSQRLKAYRQSIKNK